MAYATSSTTTSTPIRSSQLSTSPSSPSKPDEYSKFSSFAHVGLPSSSYPIPFTDPGQSQTWYSILIAGSNFGRGCSREHAPVALGASGVRAVVAESCARIFFRNCVMTDEVCRVGGPAVMNARLGMLSPSSSKNHTTGKDYRLKANGNAGPVLEADGIFAYARKAPK